MFSIQDRLDLQIFEGPEVPTESTRPGGLGWLLVMQNYTSVTDSFIRRPPGSASQTTIAAAAPSADPRLVGVVYGRDAEASRSLFAFLRALDLHPLEFETLVSQAGTGTPYIGSVVEQLFRAAHCVVVLFTPDDLAYLREDLRNSNDPDSESVATGQPRPNVLFEAGMAFGLHPDRTILVEVGKIRPISDLAGRHVVRLDGSASSLGRLMRRLDDAGARVVTTGSDWLVPEHFQGLRPK